MLGIPGVGHAEEDPDAPTLLLTPVSCPLPDRGEGAPKLSGSDRVLVREGSKLREILGVAEIDQEYFCNYEPNPAYRDLVDSGGLRICAETARGEVRAAERPKHPFFIGVLFQPQRTSRPGAPHPLIAAFVRAAGGPLTRACGEGWGG